MAPDEDTAMSGPQIAPHAASRGLAPWQVRVVLDCMSRDLRAAAPAKDLAQLCGLSRSHFGRAFKSSLGTSPHRWRVALRVRRAKELLEETSESLSDIALMCGFSDQSHLTRTFHASTGVSPGAWRRRRWAAASARLKGSGA